MDSKKQRVALIILMLGVLGYTFFNYIRGDMNITYFFAMLIFMGWMLISQIWALIRDWKE